LVLLKGDFVLDSSLQLKSFVTLQGVGLARLNFSSGLTGENMIEFLDSTDARGIVVDNLILYGNLAGNTGCRGMYFASNQSSTYIDPSKEQRIVTVTNCKVTYFAREGLTCIDIYTGYDVGTYNIERNMFHYNYRESGSYDVNFTDTTDTYFIDNELSTGYFHHLTASQVKSNYFGGGDSGGDGVWWEDCQGSLFTGNVVDVADMHGIHVSGASTSDIVISDNRISKSGQHANATYSGIFISSTVGSSYIVITGNIIYYSYSVNKPNYPLYGVYEEAGANYNIICNNAIRGYSSSGYGVYWTGANTVVADNIGSTLEA
jgi:hypothetical protein